MPKEKKCTVFAESVSLCGKAVDIEVCLIFLFNLESVEPYLL